MKIGNTCEWKSLLSTCILTKLKAFPCCSTGKLFKASNFNTLDVVGEKITAHACAYASWILEICFAGLSISLSCEIAWGYERHKSISSRLFRKLGNHGPNKKIWEHVRHSRSESEPQVDANWNNSLVNSLEKQFVIKFQMLFINEIVFEYWLWRKKNAK